MRVPRLLPDTIAVRFVMTVVLAALVTVGLNLLLSLFGGFWGQPSMRETGLLRQASAILQIVDASPPGNRPAMLAGIHGQDFRAEWYASDSSLSATFAASARLKPVDADWQANMPTDFQRPHVAFRADSALAVTFWADHGQHPDAYFAAFELSDRSWMLFTAFQRSWGPAPRYYRAIEITFVTFSILATSFIATRLLSQPIRDLADGVRRFGMDPKAPSLDETGPRELRAVIAAFNAMQEQIQRFVGDRTEMLAAISHDLRTPLTRIRLRAELMEDLDQQRKLFRDVDDMQAMVDSALAFFRDDVSGEAPTSFDLPELLRTVVEDYNDRGEPVSYEGPARVACFGRPYALKRAIVNLVDNALKYATPPVISLECGGLEARIAVLDSGPGIPADQRQQVFMPFLRLERSRNRKTGGVGLGLTAARSIVRAHGGDISLANRVTGGLEAMIVLPLRPN